MSNNNKPTWRLPLPLFDRPNLYRDLVLTVLAMVYDYGPTAMVSVLGAILTPESTVYVREFTRDTSHRLHDIDALIVWMTRSQLEHLDLQIPQERCFGVAMFVPSEHPFQTLDFAVALLRFINTQFKRARKCFKILSIAYKVEPRGASAILVFSRRFRRAWAIAFVNSLCNHSLGVHRFNSMAVSTLRHRAPDLRNNGAIQLLFDDIRSLDPDLDSD